MDVVMMLYVVFQICVFGSGGSGEFEFSVFLVGNGVVIGDLFMGLVLMIYSYNVVVFVGVSNYGCYSNKEVDVFIECVVGIIDEVIWVDLQWQVSCLVLSDVVIILLQYFNVFWVMKKSFVLILCVDGFIMVMDICQK